MRQLMVLKVGVAAHDNPEIHFKKLYSIRLITSNGDLLLSLSCKKMHG
jgi:hypothetical protein